VHCDKATRGAARSVAIKSKVKRVIFLGYYGLRIVQGFVLKPNLPERVVH
jgi:hypothetical protein